MFTRTEVDIVSQVLRRASHRESDSDKRRVIIGSLTKLQRLRKALRKRTAQAGQRQTPSSVVPPDVDRPGEERR